MWFSVSIPPERRYTATVRELVAHVAGDAGCASGEAGRLADACEVSLGRLVAGLAEAGNGAAIRIELSVDATTLALTVSCEASDPGLRSAARPDPGRYWDREATLGAYDRYDTLVEDGVPKCRMTRAVGPARHP